MRTLITHGTIVTASDTFQADVLIDGERIAAIAESLAGPADRTIDASGRLVLPGGIDAHTHLDLPVADFASADDFESGTIAAVPDGAPGIETRMSLIYDAGVRTRRLTLNRFVDVTSAAPAKIFGLCPRKGTIAVGSDADLVIFDPERTVQLSAATHHMRVDYSLYEGRSVKGVVETVLSRGRVVVENMAFVGRAGHGEFVRRASPTPAPL